MATQYAFGKIVTDGLVLALDAADRNSYVSGSTTWRDLSPNGNNGALTNGPAFNNSIGGSISFDGTNDYLNITSGITSSTTGFTWNFWINMNQTQPVNTNFWCYFYTFESSTIEIGVYNSGNSVNNFTMVNYINAPTRPGVSVPSSLGNWINITLGCDNLIPFMYLNGSNFVTSSAFQSLTLPIQNLFRSQYYLERYLRGNLATFNVYNRALSQSEVQQNYNAQKSRFGLT